jgi:hypothetical protein
LSSISPGEAIITGGALLSICEALEERTGPVLAKPGTTPEAIPEVRAETPESQENQAAENRKTPLILHHCPRAGLILFELQCWYFACTSTLFDKRQEMATPRAITLMPHEPVPCQRGNRSLRGIIE